MLAAYAYAQRGKMEDPWRHGGDEVEGWCFIRNRAGVDICCGRDCSYLRVGCLCEGCGLAMRRLEAQKAFMTAEDECRAFERREVKRGECRWSEVRRMRRQRNRRTRVLWDYVLLRTRLLEGRTTKRKAKAHAGTRKSDI